MNTEKAELQKKQDHRALIEVLCITLAITCTGAANESSAALLTVTNLNDGGAGSLRAIITTANANSQRDSVIFSVAGTIALSSALPSAVDPGGGVIIDGWSAPGTVIVDGSSVVSGPGFEFGGDGGQGNVIRGVTIRNFPGPGVLLQTLATRTKVSQCVIYGNGGSAIDFYGNGVTPNDPGDVDAGPNGLLNFPVIDTVFQVGPDSFYVAGTSAAGSTVELFVADVYLGADTLRNPNAHGDAWRYLGSATASGTGHFAFPALKFRVWSWLTATATDAAANTSELSANRQLVPDPFVATAYSPIALTVITPSGQDSIGADPITGTVFNTIGSTATYDSTTDHGFGPDPDDRVVITNIEPGDYTIRANTKPGGSGSYVLGIRVDGTEQSFVGPGVTGSATPIEIPVPPEGQPDTWHFSIGELGRGDFNGDSFLDAVDLNLLIDILFFNGPTPVPALLADVDCSQFADAVDMNYLVDHLFFNGAEPCR